MTLIPNWRRASVLFGSLPEAAQSQVLDLVGVPASRVPAVLGLLMIAGRVISQPKVDR